jgi:DNA-directed RNA polymerase specialized sigma24 family protein
MEDDLALVRRAAAGERAAFDTLFERYADKVFCYAAARARSSAEAERACEVALARVFGELHLYAGAVGLDAWVLDRVHRACAAQLAAAPAAATPRVAATS